MRLFSQLFGMGNSKGWICRCIFGNLNKSWAAHFQGGWHSKFMQKSFWSPLIGFLKLNFDGSYFCHINMGGIDGVIGDSSGMIVKNYSGPVSSLDSNGAEVFALLVGCRKLWKLGGYNAIIEGDSFSAIQWGFGRSSYPWLLADLVKEIIDISD